MTGTKTDPATERRVLDLLAAGRSQREVAAEVGCARSTVGQVAARARGAGGGSATATLSPPRLPDPAPEAGGPSLPEPVHQTYEPYLIDATGDVGVLCDPHLPYHDKATIERWADECRRRAVKAVLLNGDVLDCYQLSKHYKEPNKGRFRDEVDCGKQFFAWLRSRFPNARIVYKEGNHDERLRTYLAERAPALFEIEELDLRTILGLDALGVEWVDRKRVVKAGKLSVVHGHEFKGSGGVMPARWLFLRTGSTAMCGHFHQSSYYTFRTLDQREIGVWSVGCACYLSPEWLPANQWSHGWAVVSVAQDGGFHVDNRRLLRNGQVV